MAELTCAHCGEPVRAGAVRCPRCLRDPRPLAGSGPAEPALPTEAVTTALPEAATAARVPAGSAADDLRCDVLLVLPDHRTVPLPEGAPVELGRATLVPEIDEALEDFLDVSRHHVVLQYVDGAVTVTRTQARAESAVLAEDRPIEQTGILRVGERLRLGKHCWFKVVRA